MKNISFFPRIAGLLILLGCMFYGSSLFAQTGCGKGSPSNVTNKGKEFYIVFMQNEDNVTDVNKPTRYQHIFLASDDSDATVTVTCDAFPNNVDTFHLSKGQSTAFKISEKYPSDDYIVENTDTISKKAIHVVSTSPIVCYGMNHKEATADAFLALPINVLETGLSYKVISYPNSHAQAGIKFSEFAVAAFRDNTKVIITPNATTQAGNLRKVPFSVTLNHGECIQFQAKVVGDPVAEDLTGSDIVATQPIAVYGGHQRTEVPSGGVFVSRDHLAESIAPFATWGREFIVASFVDSLGKRLTGGILRIVSGSNANIVTFGGNISVPSFTLQAGEHRDITIDPATIGSVRTTQPSILGMISNSTTNGINGIGDPFFAIVPSVDQLYTDYTYFVSTDPVYREKDTSNNFLLVVTEMTGVGALVLTDSNNNTYTPAISDYSPRLSINGTSYSVLWFQHPKPGLWHIHTPNIYQRGINIIAYGFGNIDSYGYTAGGLYVPKNGIVQTKKNAAAPYPGVPQVPVFGIQNVLGVPVYLDSMTITYTSNSENIPVSGVGIRPHWSFGELQPLEEKKVVLSPERPSSQPIDGIATIYYRSGLWSGMYPLEVNFHIEPGAMASVSSAMPLISQVTVASNPSRIGVDEVLSISLTDRAQTSVMIYDALGRLVTVACDEMLESGTHPVRIASKLMKAGTYFYNVNIAGESKRGAFVVTP
jgi:hypothetical protein